MADFSIASQIRPVQLPDQLQQYAQINQLALHQAQLAEVQRAANEQNQLRSFLESGVDRNSPEFLKQVYKISPTTGMTLEKGQAELQNAALTRRKTEGELALQPEALKKAQAETAAANAKHLTEQLKNVLAYPDDERAGAAYGTLRASAVQMHPEWDAVLPNNLDRKVLEQQVLTAEQAAKQQFELAKPQFQTIENPDGSKTIVRVAPGGGPATPVAGGTGAPKPAEAWSDTSGRRYQPIKNAAGEIIGQREITPGVVGVPMTGATAPAVGDAQAMRTAQIEGTGKNPMSSAQGLHQFIDSTFVGTAKKVFPELASKSPAEILALRGTKLADGTPIESALEQRFRTDNIASLTSAGIQPTPGNTYLAHFLGAGGARSVLGADPNTPVSQLLSPDAIAANKSVLEGKTAGEVAAWAANKFGNQPGLAASMTASNARLGGAPAGFVPANNALISSGAPTVNNALMANMFGAPAPQTSLAMQPQISGALTPAAPQLAAPVAMSVGQTPAAAPSATANMSPVARADYEKKTVEAMAAQETAKANKKETGQYILRTLGGEGSKKIEDLINASTSGAIQKWGAEVKGAFGEATPGMQNIGTLDHIAKQMTYDLLNGKLGAGISNADRDFISSMVANIANPNIPANERIAGFRQLKNTMEAWANGKNVEIGAPIEVSESGVPRGRRGTLNSPATASAPAPASAKAPAGVPQNVWDVMTPQERALF